MFQEQSSEGPPQLSLPQEAKEATPDTPSANDELDTPTSIASVMTSTNESSTETDTPLQTDTEVHDFTLGHTSVSTCLVPALCYKTTEK